MTDSEVLRVVRAEFGRQSAPERGLAAHTGLSGGLPLPLLNATAPDVSGVVPHRLRASTRPVCSVDIRVHFTLERLVGGSLPVLQSHHGRLPAIPACTSVPSLAGGPLLVGPTAWRTPGPREPAARYNPAMQLDPTTKAVIEVIRGAGYAVSLRYDKVTFTATAQDAGGETWTVTAAEPYAAVCELAEQVGIELEDG